ncbi:MAG: hypothetical protein U0271_26930 [Polyangiaceae bacterium]
MSWNYVCVVALAASLVVGCSAQVINGNCEGDPPVANDDCDERYECVGDQWELVESSCADPGPGCPIAEPWNGDPCEEVGRMCSYDHPCGTLTTLVAECTVDGWLTWQPRCGPSGPCPIKMPVVGTDCSDYSDAPYCYYSVSCGAAESEVTLECIPGGDWAIVDPATCADCRLLANEASCATATGCEWLRPGCGDEAQPPIVEGCYPVEDCQTTGCAADEVCVDFTYDPCAGQDCNACGATYSVCLL